MWIPSPTDNNTYTATILNTSIMMLGNELIIYSVVVVGILILHWVAWKWSPHSFTPLYGMEMVVILIYSIVWHGKCRLTIPCAHPSLQDTAELCTL